MFHPRFSIKVIAGLSLFTVSSALAGPPEVPTAPAPVSPWEFRLEPYAWLTGLSGTLGVAYQTVPVDLGFKSLAQHLKMAYAGQFEARYNRWGLQMDFFYSDIGGYIPVQDPRIRQLSTASAQRVFQLTPNYRVYRSNKGFFDVLAGIRVVGSEARLTGFRDVGLNTVDFRYFNNSQSKAWVDGIVGVRGQYFLLGNSFVAAYADIGGGSSKLTWQVQGTLGYKFSDKISTELGWRLLSDNYQEGGFTYNLKQQGLFTGMSIRW